MSTTADRRSLEASSSSQAAEMIRRGHAMTREGELLTARGLARMQRDKSHLSHGCSTAVDFAACDGVDLRRARELLALGQTMDADPRVEEEVRYARVTPQAAAQLAPVVTKPGCVAVGEDWLEKAKTCSPTQLRNEVRARTESHAQQDRVVTLSLCVRESTRERFRRARTLAMRRAGCAMTEWQAFTVIVEEYVERHDPLLKPKGVRRVGPTSARRGDRYVPAEVRNSVRARAGDRCEVRRCGNDAFLQFAHIEAHAAGGDREPGNLLQLCTTHHTALDAGMIRFARFESEGPVFVNVRDGQVVGARLPALFAPQRARAPPDEVAEGCPAYRPRGGRSRRSALRLAPAAM